MMPVAVKTGLDKTGLSFGKEVAWFVTFVEANSGLFYMQLADPSIAVKYERLYQEIEGAVVGGKVQPFVCPPEIGGLCIAQYTEDQQWYRGQILSIDPEDDEAEIYFIDYGNGESMSWRALRMLPQGFSELPAQAFQCRLANIEPVGGIWSKEAIELLKELISERELVGLPTHLCKTGAVVVKLFADEDKSVMVAQQLVMAGFAHWKKTKSSVSQSSSNASASSSSSNPLSVNVKPGQLGQIKVKAESFLDLCISYIANLDDFHCQPVQHSDSLNAMIEEMQTFYNSSQGSDLRVTSLNVDQLCCAKFSGDGIWYRSSVKKITGGGKYEVVFLDFGNTEVLPISEIRELSPKFKQLPVVGLHCCLYGVSPANGNASFSDDAFVKFEELTFEKQLVGNVKKVEDSGKVNLILLDTTSNKEGLNLNEELAKTGQVVYTNNLDVSPKKSDSSQSATQGTVQPHFVSIAIEKGGMEVGWVAFATTPFDFYCQLERNSDNLENMMQELNDEYAQLKPGENKLQSFQPGVPCCAKYSGDGRFYRAELKIIEKTNAMVHFVDYGNEEHCRADELKHLRKEYLKLPKQAIKCKLAAIQAPASGIFPADVSARFNEMVMDKEFNLTFIAVDSNGFNKVSLIEKNDTNVMTFDVAKSLIESGLVSKVTASSKGDQGQIITNKRYTELQVPLDDYIDVTPTVVTDPNHFCCQLLENVDDIDTMMAELEENYRDSKPNNNVQLKNGMPCVALYPEDNAWYRAVLARLSGREAEVTYVDFGNTEKIPSSNIRPIYAKFMTLPAQTFVCSLFDVKPQGSKDWSKGSIEEFSNLVLEQQLIACVKKKDESNMHHVELLDTTSNRKQQTSISEVLIEKGFAASSKSQPSQPSDARSVSSNASNASRTPSSTTSTNVSSVTIKDEENIFITFVESPASFYCQLTSATEKLDQIMEELENKYSQAGPTDLKLAAASPGQLCAAFFTDGAWYRGRIVRKVDSNTVHVYYIDYGNSEDVLIKDVKQLVDGLAKEPGFALQCSLKGVSPKSGKWDPDSIDKFTNMTENKEFDATFITKQPPYNVSLKQNGIDVVPDILNKGIGVAPGAVSSSSSTKEYKETQLKPGAVENVYVAHVDDLDNIYCQLARCEDDLNNLMVQVGEKAPGLAKLSALKPSLPVCAKYSADDEWYRGEITNVVSSQTANVRFIDYGNSENVNMSSMREISSELLIEPKYAVCCSLDHGGLKWKDNAIEEFLGKTTDKVLKMAVKDAKTGKIVIELRDENDASVVSNLIITNQSSVSRPNEAPQAQPKLQSEAVNSMPNDTAKGFPESEIRCDVEIGFYVSHVNSLSDFYIQDASRSDPLDEMMQQLETTPKQAGFFKTATVGMACMTEFSEDNGLYRAEVESVRGSTVLVRFVDYGNTEEKSLIDLYSLPRELLNTSPFAVKCCLKGAISQLSENELRKFKDATFDKILKGKLRRLNADKYELTMSDTSITSIYCKSESKAQIRLQHIQTNAGSSLDCYVSHTESLNEFYVQPAKYEADLDKVVENMSRAGSNPALSAPSMGQFCCAKFSEDEQWYRGEITGQSGDKFKVLFVDYGNSETVVKSDLKVLPAEMLTIPCLSIPCTFDVAPGQAQPDIDKFINDTADQILSVEFIGNDANGRNTVTLKLDGKQLFSAAKKDPGLHVEKPEPSPAEPCSNAQSPAVIVEFNEASIPVGTSEQAVISYVVTPQEFYCQLGKDLAKLDEVMDKLEGHYRSLGPSEKRLKSMVPGMPCAAKYSVDDAWYRASLECLESATHAKIKFVDYGNVESIAIADVKELTEELQQEPMFAVKCSMVGDVGPTSEFENRVVEQTFEVKVTGRNGGTHMVDLINDGHSLSKELSGKNPPVAVSKSVHESSVQYNDIGMKPGDKQNVYFVDGASPSEFYCHLVKHEAEFETLMNDIASDVGSLPKLEQLVKGKPCIGMFSEDGGWYRGRILDTKPGEARLFFVDYGNEEWVSNDNIKSMPAKFVQLPIQAVLCSLNSVNPASVSWSQSETELLKSKCADKVMILSVMAVENGKPSVVLEDAETGEKVNDAFVKDGSKSVEGEKESKAVSSIMQYKYDGMNKGMKLAVTCTFINSADKISCQLTKYQAQLDDLMADIATYCNSNAKGVSNATTGMPCLALFSEDNAWYRASVTAVNGGSVTVKFVDYGNEAEVKKDQLGEVRPKDMELPVTCFDCQIPGIALNDDAMMYIEELCLEQELIVEVKDVVEAGVVIGDICKVDSGESITKIVQGKFPCEASSSEKRVISDVAPQSKQQLQYLKPELNVGDTENIMCSHVTSVNIVECHLSKYSEKFNFMMDKIAEYCDANTTVLKDPKVGDPCLAMYPVDGGWYRATVLSIASNDLKLRYVDYGNEDDVSFSDTREITEEFMALPTLSLTCRLHDVHVEDLDTAKGKKWLENTCCNNDYNIGVISKNGEDVEVNMYYPDTKETVNDELYAQFAYEEETADAPVEEKPTSSLEISQKTPTENTDEEKPTNVENTELGSKSQEAVFENPSEKLRLSSAEVELSVKTPATCSYIDADLNIHCQPTNYSTELDQLMTHIGDYCAEITTKPDSYESGVPCFAMFPDDQEWYRAEIQQNKGDMIEVFYVDYGNSGFVNKDQMLAMGKAFTTMPKASVTCTLEGLDKISCPSDDVKAWLEEKILEQQVDFEIKEKLARGTYKADFFIDGKSVMELLKAEFGQSVTESGNSLAKCDSGSKEDKVLKFEFPALSVQSTKATHCTHIDSLQEVYCQLLEYQSQLDHITAKMVNYCEDSNKGPANCSVGSACLAQYTLDEQWYRAEVLEILNDRVKVQFVDYGNTDVVSLQNTRVANEDFTSLPATAVKCQLHDVHNEDLDVKAAVQWLQENVVEQEVTIEVVGVVDGAHDCVVTKQGLEGTINDQLYALFEVTEEEPAGEVGEVTSENAEVGSESALVASIGVASENGGVASETTGASSECTGVASESTDIEPTSANGSEADVQIIETENAKTEAQFNQSNVKIKNAEGDSEEACSYTYENLEMGCKETVLCLHAESTQLLYCQLNRLLVKFDDVLGNINAYCDGEGLVPKNIKKGLACFAKWDNDTNWYRAEVTEVIDDRKVKVFYVDQGHSDLVLITDTRVMKKEFTAIPALTIKCQLHDVHESDLDPYAVEHWLHDDLTASGLDMVCEVVGKIEDRYDCILTFKGHEGTVNDELYEKFELQEANEDDNGSSKNGIVSNSGSDVFLTAPVSIASVTSTESEAKSADNAELNPDASEFVPPTDKVVSAEAIDTLDPAAGEFVPSDGPNSKTKLAVSSRDVSIDTSLVMHLSFVNSPSSFWCQFDDSGDDLIQLMGEIEEVYAASDIPPVTSVPKVGSFCCAQFSEDEQWYRGEVMERGDADSCLVKFIDYGNVEKTDIGKIKELKPEFFVLKKQAVECSLHGVKATADDGQWSEEAIAEFENMCTQGLKVDVIHREGERINAIIKIVESDINVNHTMIEKGLGISDVTKTNGVS